MNSILDEPVNDYLMHFNVKGTKWYQHKFGNWERHAKYANGQPNPETSGSRGPYSSAEARDARLAKKDRKRGTKDAKKDAAIQVLNKGKEYNFRQRLHALNTINPFSDYLKGYLLGDVAFLAGTSLATGQISTLTLTAASKFVPVSVRVPVGGIVGAAAYPEYTKRKAIKGYNERYKDSTKDFNKRLSKSTINDLNLSKDYVKAYSEAMDEALKIYDSYKSKAK